MTITLPWSFFASLLMTILLCIHYGYFGSTINPLATARQSLATMAGLSDGFTMLPEGHEPIVSGVTFADQTRPSRQPQSVPKPSTASNPTSPPGTMPT
eukprot:3805161-Amphidinium_carterae.1